MHLIYLSTSSRATIFWRQAAERMTAALQEYDIYWEFAHHASEAVSSAMLHWILRTAGLSATLQYGYQAICGVSHAVCCEHAELWDKHHVHAELQQEKANLWTKKEWPTWNPCNQTELDRQNGYWAVNSNARSCDCML